MWSKSQQKKAAQVLEKKAPVAFWGNGKPGFGLEKTGSVSGARRFQGKNSKNLETKPQSSSR